MVNRNDASRGDRARAGILRDTFYLSDYGCVPNDSTTATRTANDARFLLIKQDMLRNGGGTLYVDGFYSFQDRWVSPYDSSNDQIPFMIVGTGARATLDFVMTDTTDAEWRDPVSLGTCTFEATEPTAITNDDVTLVAHGLEVGDPIEFTNSGGNLPTSKSSLDPNGLAAGRRYYVFSKTDDTFKIAQGQNGSKVTWDDDGAGTHTLWRAGDLGILAKMPAISIARHLSGGQPNRTPATAFIGLRDLTIRSNRSGVYSAQNGKDVFLEELIVQATHADGYEVWLDEFTSGFVRRIYTMDGSGDGFVMTRSNITKITELNSRENDKNGFTLHSCSNCDISGTFESNKDYGMNVQFNRACRIASWEENVRRNDFGQNGKMMPQNLWYDNYDCEVWNNTATWNLFADMTPGDEARLNIRPSGDFRTQLEKIQAYGTKVIQLSDVTGTLPEWEDDGGTGWNTGVQPTALSPATDLVITWPADIWNTGASCIGESYANNYFKLVSSHITAWDTEEPIAENETLVWIMEYQLDAAAALLYRNRKTGVDAHDSFFDFGRLVMLWGTLADDGLHPTQVKYRQKRREADYHEVKLHGNLADTSYFVMGTRTNTPDPDSHNSGSFTLHLQPGHAGVMNDGITVGDDYAPFSSVEYKMNIKALDVYVIPAS